MEWTFLFTFFGCPVLIFERKNNIMVTKQDFDIAAKKVATNFASALPKMIGYKNYVQKAVLDIASRKELENVRDCKINQGMIDKLCRLAKGEWNKSEDAQSLYCAAMAVATIVKEYDWGTGYLIGDGLWEIADRIQRS